MNHPDHPPLWRISAALLALLLWPIVWLLTLPFRLVGIAVEGVFALLRSIVMLPSRVLGSTSIPSSYETRPLLIVLNT